MFFATSTLFLVILTKFYQAYYFWCITRINVSNSTWDVTGTLSSFLFQVKSLSSVLTATGPSPSPVTWTIISVCTQTRSLSNATFATKRLYSPVTWVLTSGTTTSTTITPWRSCWLRSNSPSISLSLDKQSTSTPYHVDVDPTSSISAPGKFTRFFFVVHGTGFVKCHCRIGKHKFVCTGEINFLTKVNLLWIGIFV